MTELKTLDDLFKTVDELINDQAFDEARHALEKILYDEPAHGKTHGYLGWLYMTHYQDLERASIHYECALKFDPDFAGAYINYAVQHLNTKQPDKALEVLRKAQNIQAIDTSIVLEMMGQAYELKGNYRASLKSFKEALKQTVDNWQAETLLSHIKRVRKKRWMLRKFF